MALALRGIAEEQAKAGDVAGALKTAAAIDDASAKAHALSAVAEAQAEAGDITEALKTAATIDITEALKTAATIVGPDWKFGALYAIVNAQTRAGNLAGAVSTCEKVMQLAVIDFEDMDLTSRLLGKAVCFARIAANGVDAGHLRGTLAWAATLGGDPAAKAGALVGAASAMLQPSRRPGHRDIDDLLPGLLW